MMKFAMMEKNTKAVYGKMFTQVISKIKDTDRKVSEFLMEKENDPVRRDREMMSRYLMRKW